MSMFVRLFICQVNFYMCLFSFENILIECFKTDICPNAFKKQPLEALLKINQLERNEV